LWSLWVVRFVVIHRWSHRGPLPVSSSPVSCQIIVNRLSHRGPHAGRLESIVRYIIACRWSGRPPSLVAQWPGAGRAIAGRFASIAHYRAPSLPWLKALAAWLRPCRCPLFAMLPPIEIKFAARLRAAPERIRCKHPIFSKTKEKQNKNYRFFTKTPPPCSFCYLETPVLFYLRTSLCTINTHPAVAKIGILFQQFCPPFPSNFPSFSINFSTLFHWHL